MSKVWALALGLSFAGVCAEPPDNTLSAEEKKAGYRLLFDGKTMKGWRDPARQTPPGNAWEIADGCPKPSRTRASARI
jgi:hypothetical protein